jgi:hypothetical protein
VGSILEKTSGETKESILAWVFPPIRDWELLFWVTPPFAKIVSGAIKICGGRMRYSKLFFGQLSYLLSMAKAHQ